MRSIRQISATWSFNNHCKCFLRKYVRASFRTRRRRCKRRRIREGCSLHTSLFAISQSSPDTKRATLLLASSTDTATLCILRPSSISNVKVQRQHRGYSSRRTRASNSCERLQRLGETFSRTCVKPRECRVGGPMSLIHSFLVLAEYRKPCWKTRCILWQSRRVLRCLDRHLQAKRRRWRGSHKQAEGVSTVAGMRELLYLPLFVSTTRSQLKSSEVHLLTTMSYMIEWRKYEVLPWTEMRDAFTSLSDRILSQPALGG